MNHKLILFANSSNPMLIAYHQKQLQAITNLFPDLAVEQGNEDSPLLLQFSSTPDRLPCIMILKYQSCKSYIHANLDDNQLIAWVTNKLG